MKLQKNCFGKMLCAILLLAGLVTACYDDSDVREQLRDHESRLKELERLTAQQNTNISSLQTIVTALQDKDYVTNVSPINEGGEVVGYTITFSKSGTVTIYNGKDGYVQAMGVKQDTDGEWYWTVDGEWLLDTNGHKVRASAVDGEDGESGAPGQSGVTPTLKIVDGYWYVSYDGGKTWEDDTLGQATGDNGYTMFAEVTYDEEYLYITMADGEKLTLSLTADDAGDGDPETGGEGENNDAITNISGGVTLTLSLRNLTETGVSFYGEAKLAENYTANSFGILYSTHSVFTAANADNLPIVDIYGTNYSVSTSSLKPNTTYYYTSYIKQGDLYKYGDIKSFTTKSLVAPELDDASEITEVSSTISGTVNLAVGTASDLEYGFQYSVSETFSSGVVSRKVTDIDSENKFSMQIASLVPATTYYCRSYIRMNGVYAYGDIKSFTTKSLVAPELDDASEITEVSSTISGTVSLVVGMAGDLEYGFQYSVSETFSSGVVSRKVTDIDSENKFSMQIASLVPATTYYCRSYIRMNGVYAYGDIKSFTTMSLVAPELDDASEITYSGVRLSGIIPVFSEALMNSNYVYLECGVLVSVLSSFPNEESLKYSVYSMQPPSNGDSGGPLQREAKTEVLGGGDFTIVVSKLEAGKIYYYCSYICVNGKVVLGDTKTFTTLPGPYNNQADLNIYSAADLSLSSSANCYIVSNPGLYKFKTVKGNSSESVGSVVSASILWETFGTDTAPTPSDLIDGVCYKDGYIAFQTADVFKEGNAVIAAKDADDNILWSWHIWFTDQPQGQEYYNNAGTMMDRNLGATSATPGDVGTLGLLYQWGRKDPFLVSSSISSSTVAESTITWPSAVESNPSNGTIAYATAHPTTFITRNTGNYDWYYTGSSSTDNTRWTTLEKDKSIYDPCPVGWRVPDGGSNGVWSTALGSSSSFIDHSLYSSSNKGMNFSGKFGSASTIWYPSSGCSNPSDGSLDSVGDDGSYWSATPNGSRSDRAYGLDFSYDGCVYPSKYYGRAYGNSVRCLQVIDEVAGANAEESK